MKVVLKTKQPSGNIVTTEKVTRSGDRKVVRDIQTDQELSPGSYPVNAPRVGAKIGLKMSANYNSAEVGAWVELPVDGFGRAEVEKTQAEAFRMAEDIAVSKMEELKQVLRELS